jgi:hypothetical protein
MAVSSARRSAAAEPLRRGEWWAPVPLVTGEDRGDRSPGWDRLIPAYGATIRDEGHRERVKWAGRSYTMSRELVLVAGRPCDLPGCAASADP